MINCTDLLIRRKHGEFQNIFTIFTVDIPSANYSLNIFLQTDNVSKRIINWGESTQFQPSNNQDNSDIISHEYKKSGKYNIYILYGIKSFRFPKQTVYIKHADISVLDSYKCLLSGCINIEKLPDDMTVNNDVRDCSYMFDSCSSLADFGGFRIPSECRNAQCMFRHTSSAPAIQDNTVLPNSLQNAEEMFSYSSVQIISQDSVLSKNLTNMKSMFKGSQLKKIPQKFSFDGYGENVNISSMFQNTQIQNTANITLSGCNIKIADCLFKNCHYIRNINDFQFNSNITSINEIFYKCTNLLSILKLKWVFKDDPSTNKAFARCTLLNFVPKIFIQKAIDKLNITIPSSDDDSEEDLLSYDSIYEKLGQVSNINDDSDEAQLMLFYIKGKTYYYDISDIIYNPKFMFYNSPNIGCYIDSKYADNINTYESTIKGAGYWYNYKWKPEDNQDAKSGLPEIPWIEKVDYTNYIYKTSEAGEFESEIAFTSAEKNADVLIVCYKNPYFNTGFAKEQILKANNMVMYCFTSESTYDSLVSKYMASNPDNNGKYGPLTTSEGIVILCKPFSSDKIEQFSPQIINKLGIYTCEAGQFTYQKQTGQYEFESKGQVPIVYSLCINYKKILVGHTYGNNGGIINFNTIQLLRNRVGINGADDPEFYI